ncbi:unnamed protein product [Eruca vesicaria subsp. sativa]|uniref:Replication factor A C-terminal domain-containing protein n=1 Tax=Eruca vesicaria subsp. sativa TaxID=29727 RepID=A0ABC8LEC9_ERUVS|nr:unnamed protein product [Eruca vesicaria subsp. sativa]
MTSGKESAVPSVRVKNLGATGISSGHLNSTRLEDLSATKSSAIKPSPKRGSSSGVNLAGGRKEAISAAAKGKSIVSDVVVALRLIFVFYYGFKSIHRCRYPRDTLISQLVAWFECTATIDDVDHGAGWYYIGCRVCHTKAIKGPTTLMCKKCGKHEIDAVPQYHSKLNVYDHKDQAVFVFLGDAGEELTGKKAAELVDNYYQVNGIEEEDHIVPVPQALINTIGQTRKFVVKVSAYNLTGKSQSVTVTKVFPLEEEEPEVNIGDEAGEAPVANMEDEAEESVKRSADVIEGEEAKRSKLG